MQYNVFFGNDDYDAIVVHIDAADADIVALHELLPEQWEALKPRLDHYPHQIAAPLADADGEPGGGMALLSRTPLDPVAVGEEISPTERVMLVATTDLDDQRITIVGLHPHASRTDSYKVDLRRRQLDGVADLVGRTDNPAVVLADLNLAPTSPRYGDFVDALGWRDPHHVVGWQSSWPNWVGPFGLPIDHVLVSNHVAIHGYATRDGAGSDHKSVIAELSLVASN